MNINQHIMHINNINHNRIWIACNHSAYYLNINHIKSYHNSCSITLSKSMTIKSTITHRKQNSENQHSSINTGARVVQHGPCCNISKKHIILINTGGSTRVPVLCNTARVVMCPENTLLLPIQKSNTGARVVQYGLCC